MTRKNVGVLGLLLAVGVILLSASVAGAWTLSWNAVTTYTDNTAITDPVTYDAWADGAPIGTGITGTSVVIPDPGHGQAHFYEVAAVVNGVSSTRAGLNWTSPLGVPLPPSNLTISE